MFLCAFLRTNKPIYTPIPSRPLAPIPGYIFCYVRRRLLNKPSQWKCSSSGNHGHGCATAWQEERDDQQKNKYRRWESGPVLMSKSTEGGPGNVSVTRCVCVSVFKPVSEVCYVITVGQVWPRASHSSTESVSPLLKYCQRLRCTSWQMWINTHRFTQVGRSAYNEQIGFGKTCIGLVKILILLFSTWL